MVAGEYVKQQSLPGEMAEIVVLWGKMLIYGNYVI